MHLVFAARKQDLRIIIITVLIIITLIIITVIILYVDATICVCVSHVSSMETVSRVTPGRGVVMREPMC